MTVVACPTPLDRVRRAMFYFVFFVLLSLQVLFLLVGVAGFDFEPLILAPIVLGLLAGLVGL